MGTQRIARLHHSARLAGAALLLCAAAAPARAKPAAGVVAGTVTVRAGGQAKADRSGVVVYLEPAAAAGTNAAAGVPAAAHAHSIHQRKLGFTPTVSVVPKGATVQFPNDDKVFHNVFSLSKGNRFDLGLYKSGASKSVTFKKAGVVDIYCNIHPQMVAKLLVVDGLYDETDAAGGFRIEGVAPGTYPVVAWQANGPEYRGEVVVVAGKTATVTIELVEGNKPSRHLRKDGTPYGRYK